MQLSVHAHKQPKVPVDFHLASRPLLHLVLQPRTVFVQVGSFSVTLNTDAGGSFATRQN